MELAKKMMKRDSATAPTVGDRVAFVIVKGAKGAKASEKAEDPIYALENNVPLDAHHYLEHHLAQPLMRIFEPILGEKKAKSLLCGVRRLPGTVARVAQPPSMRMFEPRALPHHRQCLQVHSCTGLQGLRMYSSRNDRVVGEAAGSCAPLDRCYRVQGSTSQRKDMITKHQLPLHVMTDSTVQGSTRARSR